MEEGREQPSHEQREREDRSGQVEHPARRSEQASGSAHLDRVEGEKQSLPRAQERGEKNH